MDILSVCVLYVCVLSRVLCLLPVEVDAHAEALSPHDEGAGLRLEWGGGGPVVQRHAVGEAEERVRHLLFTQREERGEVRREGYRERRAEGEEQVGMR